MYLPSSIELIEKRVDARSTHGGIPHEVSFLVKVRYPSCMLRIVPPLHPTLTVPDDTNRKGTCVQ